MHYVHLRTTFEPPHLEYTFVFLQVLADRGTAIADGKVLVNGKPRTKETKRHTGYVMQRDIFFETLTIYQTIRFTALLRCGRNV